MKKYVIRREGFWKEGKDSHLPMPIPRKHPWKGKHKFLLGLLKAQSFAESISFKGWSNCRICKNVNGSVTFEFKGWWWPSGYFHYVEKHNVRPSLAFQEFILGEFLE